MVRGLGCLDNSPSFLRMPRDFAVGSWICGAFVEVGPFFYRDQRPEGDRAFETGVQSPSPGNGRTYG